MSRPMVLLSESTLERIALAANRSHPLETGGILVGVHTGGLPWITDMVEISTNARGRTSYRIPRGATRSAVRGLRERDPRLGYLGDWHSHPMDVPASPTDRATLVATSAKAMAPVILLVARRVGSSYSHDVHLARGVVVRPCDASLAGDLPEPTNEGKP